MAANSRLEKLTREGENIGSWAGKKIHKVEFLYEAAEKCRAEGYKQYQNQRLDIAYVMFLRFAKFYELIKTQPSLDPKSPAHNKCKRHLLQSLQLGRGAQALAPSLAFALGFSISDRRAIKAARDRAVEVAWVGRPRADGVVALVFPRLAAANRCGISVKGALDDGRAATLRAARWLDLNNHRGRYGWDGGRRWR